MQIGSVGQLRQCREQLLYVKQQSIVGSDAAVGGRGKSGSGKPQFGDSAGKLWLDRQLGLDDFVAPGEDDHGQSAQSLD